MAKISELKKDVNFVASEVITQCFLTSQLFPEAKDKDVNKVIYKAIDFKTDYIKKINAFPKKSGKTEIKAYFKKIETDMVKETQKLLKEIEKIRKTKE